MDVETILEVSKYGITISVAHAIVALVIAGLCEKGHQRTMQIAASWSLFTLLCWMISLFAVLILDAVAGGYS